MTFESWFHQIFPGIPSRSMMAVLKLASEGSTVPFIARYRKEATGNLDEVAIQAVLEGKEKWEEIIKRQKFILEEIEDQKKLTPELKASIEKCFDLNQLEDLYLPYKKKRKTKAQKAKDSGLGPLAEWIWETGHGAAVDKDLVSFAMTFFNEEIETLEEAIGGAQDILIERLSEMQSLRQFVRDRVFSDGKIAASKGDKAKDASKFQDYFQYSESIASLGKAENSHRYLAIRRGWTEEELKLTIGGGEGFDVELLNAFLKEALTSPSAPGKEILEKAAQLALKAYVLPSIENEVHTQLKESADEAAIRVFAENVKKLLLAAPFGSKAVMGVDPGIRTGCKVAIVDDSGKFVGNFVIQTQSETDQAQSAQLLSHVIENGKIRAVAVGNGTAGRETEIFIRKILKEKGLDVPVVMVNESGASIYSASEAAREEFPDLDLTVRGAISIARRLQDPLAELVKVDPKSIGVGQYQHDVSQPRLKKSLESVVESCVNSVGVDLNTASYHLLAYVSGIGPQLAKNILNFRTKNGLFKSRRDLTQVSRFSDKIFEQSAGFLRIRGGAHPLDNTGVHPERYPALEKVAREKGVEVAALVGSGASVVRESAELKTELGEFTFADVLAELEKPGRDPREQFVPFQFREDIHEITDLKADMLCPGIVTNVANFGAFVDIGVHTDGLVHISELADKFVKDPREVVNPGDHVQVKVVEVDLARKRITLSMRTSARKVGESKQARPPREQRPERKPEKRPERKPERRPDRKPEQRADQRSDRRFEKRPESRPEQRTRPQERPPQPRAPREATPMTHNPFAALAKLKK